MFDNSVLLNVMWFEAHESALVLKHLHESLSNSIEIEQAIISVKFNTPLVI